MTLGLESVRGMARSEVLSRLRSWFDVRELVCPHVWGRFGDGSWVFLDTDLLRVIVGFKVDFNVLIVIPIGVLGGFTGGITAVNTRI